MGDGITAVRQAYLHDRRVGRFVKFAALLSLFAFGFWSIDVLQIPIDRVLGMFGRVGNMVWQRLLPPDLVYATSASVIYARITSYNVCYTKLLRQTSQTHRKARDSLIPHRS